MFVCSFEGVWDGRKSFERIVRIMSLMSGRSIVFAYMMREWLSGGALPSQGEGRGFESRLALISPLAVCQRAFSLLFISL